jgi:hypothetical protein
MKKMKMMRKLSVSPKRFANLAKRLTKLHPASSAAKRLRPVMELELMKHVVTGGKGAAERAIKSAKVGAKKWERAQTKGSIAKWRTTLGLGMQVLEIGILVSKSMKGTTVKYQAAPRSARKSSSRSRTKK